MRATKRSAPHSSATRRRSGRLSNTPKKSNYFEGSDTENDEDGPPPKKRGRPAKKPLPVESESEDEDKYAEEEDDDDEDEDDDDDEERDTTNGQVGKYEPEEDDDDDDDAPRQVKILPLEQLRGEGGVAYKDHKVHKNTMIFLKDIKANNTRPWLKCEHTLPLTSRSML
jgi:hypothetical protein